jgi:sulfur carrier protein ThiS
VRITVHLLPTRKETVVLDLPDGATVDGAIRALGLVPDGWLAIRCGDPLPLDEELLDGNELKLVSVVSGG